MTQSSLSARLEAAALARDKGGTKVLLTRLELAFQETSAELSEVAVRKVRKSA